MRRNRRNRHNVSCRKGANHTCIVAEILAVGTAKIGINILAGAGCWRGRHRRRSWNASSSLLLPILFSKLGCYLPFHTLARLVRTAGNLLKSLVQREIMPNGVLKFQLAVLREHRALQGSHVTS